MVKTWLKERKERVKWIIKWSRRQWLWGFTERGPKLLLNVC